MRILTILIASLISIGTIAQTTQIIPQPVSIKQPKIAAKFQITPTTQIILEGSNLEKSAEFLNEYLQRFYLFKLKVVKEAKGNNVIRLNFERMDKDVQGAYRLTVDNKGIYIAGDNENGVFYGMQTLIQLLPVPEARLKTRPKSLPVSYLVIEDSPRFQYRGMHLDVSRHFFPVDFVKRYIDYLAMHKMNYFHWHLTDDQGWRIEIKRYPKLTSVGGWRNGTIIGRYPGTGNDNIRYGGFYTQEEIKEVVAYAASRYITVLPEIEMPGHASAAIAAYPELSCFPEEPTIKYYPKNCAWAGDSTGKQVVQTWGVFDDVFCAGEENTFKFLQDVLDEVLPLFPSQMVHVGGDECPKANWKRCPKCQRRMKDNGLKDEHELQSYFIQRMEKYLNSKGKKLIGWDEILEGGLAPNAAVMSWRGEEGGIAAAKQNHQVVMTPTGYVYFDYTQSTNEDSVTIGGYVNLERVYGYNPIPSVLNEKEGGFVLGAQANLWTEYIKNTRKVEYMIFPRLSALSEVLWTPSNKKNWADFEKRLQIQFKRYDLWGSNYSNAYFDLKASVQPTKDFKGVNWVLETKQMNSQLRYKLHTPNATFSVNNAKGNNYSQPVKINSSTAITAWSVQNNLVKGNPVSQEFNFNKATGKKITLANPPADKYASDGAFTLVNGIQNSKGMSRSRDFLGFAGSDCDATIDLGTIQEVKEVIVHVLEQRGSWIYYPSGMEVSVSADGKNFTPLEATASSNIVTAEKTLRLILKQPAKTRMIRIKIKNLGIIPTGLPGADNPAWLFVDEIEII